jgi:hypothetical protein
MDPLNYSTVVRSHLRLAAKIPALVIGPSIWLGLLAGGILVAWKAPTLGSRLTIPLVMWGGGAFLMYHMIHTFDWVEFDGEVLRARHLYTRRLWVCRVEDIEEVRPAYGAVKGAANALMDRIIGPVRGYEIRVAGRRRGIWMAVGDTANAKELAMAVARAIGKPIAV